MCCPPNKTLYASTEVAEYRNLHLESAGQICLIKPKVIRQTFLPSYHQQYFGNKTWQTWNLMTQENNTL